MKTHAVVILWDDMRISPQQNEDRDRRQFVIKYVGLKRQSKVAKWGALRLRADFTRASVL